MYITGGGTLRCEGGTTTGLTIVGPSGSTFNQCAYGGGDPFKIIAKTVTVSASTTWNQAGQDLELTCSVPGTHATGLASVAWTGAGRVVLSTTGNSTTPSTVSFNTVLTTANSSTYAPYVYCNSDTYYSLGGTVKTLTLQGTHTATNTLWVTNSITDVDGSVSKNWTGSTINCAPIVNGTSGACYFNSNTRFNTVNFYGGITALNSFTSIGTHNVDFCRANTITTQPANACTWNLNSIELGSALILNLPTSGTLSTININYARPISGVTTTTASIGPGGGNFANIYIEDWDIPCAVTQAGGILNIGYNNGNSMYLTSFTCNTTTARTLNFGSSWGAETWIFTKSNQPSAPTTGNVSFGPTGFSSNMGPGGIKLVGTGGNTFGALTTTAGVNLRVAGTNVSLSGGGNIASLGFEDAGAVTVASTITINKGTIYAVGSNPGAASGITLTLTTSDAYNYNFTPKLAAITLATASQTWGFDNINATTLNLNGIGCTYNYNGGNCTTINLSTTAASTATKLNLSGGTGTTVNISTNANNTTALGGFSCTGVFTFNIGILNIDQNFTCGSFSSPGTAVRQINWGLPYNDPTRIITSGTGGAITIASYTNLTFGAFNNDEFWAGGFQHGGTGAATGVGWTDTVPNMRFHTWHTGTGSYSTWNTKNFDVSAGSSCVSASTVSLTGDWTGTTTGTMTGLTLTQILAGGTITYSGNYITAYNHAVASVYQYLYRCPAINITLSGASSYYQLGIAGDSNYVVTLPTNGTITMSGNTATYSIERVRSYNTTLSGPSASYTLYNYEHNYYQAVSPTAGTFTHSAGTLSIADNANLITWAFQSSSGTRALYFGSTNSIITTINTGTITISYTSLTSSYGGENSGFKHQSTGAWGFAGTPGSVDEAFNIWTSKSHTPNTSSYVRNWVVYDGTIITVATTVNVCKNFTGVTTGSMAGITVNQTLGGGTVDYTGTGTAAIAAYTNAVANISQTIKTLTAVNITLSGANSIYDMGVAGTSGCNLSTNGTITLSGTGTAAYNLNNVRAYNLTLSGTGTYYCYYYEHNYYLANPPTAGTVTHSGGTLVMKTGYTMTTWAFQSTTGTRGITFENNSWIKTLNTGTLNVTYSASGFTAICPETNAGFQHDSTGSWTLGNTVPTDANATFNFQWFRRATIGATSYVKNFTNMNPSISTSAIGSGLIGNTTAISVFVSGNVYLSGNSASPGTIGNDANWQYLNLTAWSSGSARTQLFYSGYGNNQEATRALGILTLATNFIGTVKLGNNFSVNSVVHQSGTLDVNGQKLTLGSAGYSSTDTIAGKSIISSSGTYASPSIYITPTTGTVWSFASTNLLTSNHKIWIYCRGGTVSHGATTASTTNQPSFDLTERVSAYTLAPTTNFLVGSLRINNYTVPTLSVWNISGDEFTVYTGGLTAPASFTVNIYTGNSGNGQGICQMTCDNTSFIWPQFNFQANAKIVNSGWQFKNVGMSPNTTVTIESGQTAYVTGTITGTVGASGNSSNSKIDVTGGTWDLRSATPFTCTRAGGDFAWTSSNTTGTLLFSGLNGTNLGNQTVTFATGFGGRIVNNISYNTGTSVGVLTINTDQYYSAISGNTSTLIGQFDFGYNPGKVAFGGSHDVIRIVGTKFNLGTGTGAKYLQGNTGGNGTNNGIYNVESSSIVSGDYLNLTNMPVSGGGGWYAGTNSTNAGGNTGWTFATAPTFSLSRSTTTVNEGNTVTITLTTTGLGNGTIVPYTITGTNITVGDIASGLTGNFTVTGTTSSANGNVVLTATQDYFTEGDETFTLTLNNQAASIAVAIIDTSLTPTYQLYRSVNSVGEGDSVTITLTTTNLPSGYTIPYTISGTGITSSDFGISLTGNLVLSGNTASVTIPTTWDYIAESTETATFTINPPPGGSSSITFDIVNVARPAYTLSASPTSLNEGGNFTVTLNTYNLADNTVVPYTITGVSSSDINNASLTGSFTVINNTASATFTTTADQLTEGNETFVLTLNSIGTNISVIIIDYSKTRTYALTTTATTVTEGDSFTINLNTAGIIDGTTVPYTISGINITSADLGGASLTGNFTVYNNTASVTFNVTTEGTTEGNETLTLSLDSPASGSIQVTLRDPTTPTYNGNFLSFFD
jgi:hypothetical protein